tara:strand:- start:778 stop:1107 length:330 start_codon:yes stop_codon:yes gene_type:complete
MDIQLLQEVGLPVAGVLGLSWFILRLVKWMQDSLIKGLLDRHSELVREIHEVKTEVIADNEDLKKTVSILHDITVKLIDNEKANEIRLRELCSNLQIMLKFVNKNGGIK